jgi:predicted GTPase
VARSEERRRVLILGAAGRDFHCFNVVYRDDPSRHVIAFTASQIPGIEERRYPATLAGPLYPSGIPIEPEADLERLCGEHSVHEVVLAYSDLAHADVMHLASRALAVGADFTLLGPTTTMLRSRLPVIAVSGVRTGCGKSQTSRWIAARVRAAGRRVVALRHPMPYGQLERQRVQRFAKREDLDAARCTAEEREEYEPYLATGSVVFAGVDYAAILEQAEREADVLIWDGGNNDFPFLHPDLHIGVVDALRPGQLLTHHPGETVVRMVDVIVVNKVDAASVENVERLIAAVREINPGARIVRAASPVRLDRPEAVTGRRVLVVEDGPTITHGGMAYGAGYVAAAEARAASLVDPRASAPPEIARVFEQYPHIGPVLPAMGYSPRQLEDLRETIHRSEAEVVVSGSPIDLAALLELELPVVRARYEFCEVDEPGLGALVDAFLASRAAGAPSA